MVVVEWFPDMQTRLCRGSMYGTVVGNLPENEYLTQPTLAYPWPMLPRLYVSNASNPPRHVSNKIAGV